MKKTAISAAVTTFSLVDFPSSDHARLERVEHQIIERALELWRKKLRARQNLKTKQNVERDDDQAVFVNADPGHASLRG